MTIRETLLADYRAATALERALTEEAHKVANRRSDIIRQLHTSGMSYASIGEAVGLTYQRIQRMASR